MADILEVWRKEGVGLVALDSGRVAVGKAPTNEVFIEDDPTVSGLHAVLERYGSGWVIKDVGSTNGTFVNGERVGAERVLRSGDEIRVGGTRLVFKSGGGGGTRPVTELAEAPPDLDDGERRLLVALCRPVLSGDVFTEPATEAEIAAETGLDERAVASAIEALCARFGVEDAPERGRLRLANEAVRRGAVTIADLR